MPPARVMATLVAFFHGQTTCLIPQNVDETLVLATSRIPECLKFLELCGLVGEQTLISEFEQLVANRVETICNLRRSQISHKLQKWWSLFLTTYCNFCYILFDAVRRDTL